MLALVVHLRLSMSLSTLQTGELEVLLGRGAWAQESEEMDFPRKPDALVPGPGFTPFSIQEVFSNSRLSASFSHISRPSGGVSIQLSKVEYYWAGAKGIVACVMESESPQEAGNSEVQREHGCSVAPPFPNSRDIF